MARMITAPGRSSFIEKNNAFTVLSDFVLNYKGNKRWQNKRLYFRYEV
jgi:hypothetical protein